MPTTAVTDDLDLGMNGTLEESHNKDNTDQIPSTWQPCVIQEIKNQLNFLNYAEL